MPRVLFVLHPGSLGDVLLALPAIRALRVAFPRHAVGLMAQEGIRRLLLAGGEVHHTFSLDGPGLADILGGASSLGAEMKEWLVRCDAAVAWMTDANSEVRSALRPFHIPHVVVTSPHSPDYRSVHQTDRFLETIGSIASIHSSHDTSLQLSPNLLRHAASQLGSLGMTSSHRLVMIHPGSGSRHKCAPAKLFADLLGRLQLDGTVPLVVGGPADMEHIVALQREYGRPFPVLKDLDIASMAGVIAHADRFVGHDSGLTHLAASLHVPTIAVFGPTDPQRWAPRGPHVKVVSGASCRCPEWEAVRACVEKTCLHITLDQIESAWIPRRHRGMQTAS